jgi:hypothetical protein
LLTTGIPPFSTSGSHDLSRAGAAVNLIDHVVKDKDSRGRYAIGAQHKLAGVDVAYRLEVVHPFGRGREGLIKVAVTKDRPGFVRQYAANREWVALLRLSSEDGTVTATLTHAEGDQGALSFKPTKLMERISKLLEADPGLGRNEIRSTVGGKQTYVDLARKLLVSEGFVRVERDGQAKRHYVVKPYREEPGPSGTEPGPGPGDGNRDPGSPSPTGDPDPVPVNGSTNGRPTGSRNANPVNAIFGDDFEADR